MRALFARLARAYLSVKALRETRRELHALSDHLLRDIGLRRDQIELVGKKDAQAKSRWLSTERG